MQNEERLSETFESHEDQTPDPAAVYARVEELSRSYKWRRRGIQIAGGVVVAGGLIAGFTLVGNHNATPAPAGNSIVAAAPATSAAPVSDEVAMQAFFDRGYHYEDAVALAKAWQSTDSIGVIKADAGRKLLSGEGLPFKPLPYTEPTVDPKQVEADSAALDAFFNTGYVWTDAEQFAKLWKIKDPSDAKIAAGKKIINHEKLPIAPKPANVTAAKENKKLEAFWLAGYQAADAEKLAKIWHVSASVAKAEAGQKLIDGQTLPIKPSGPVQKKKP
ncbi:hypothetical protein HH310_14465 [Actinoplanes sp. TBRC 11911]|uniref:hypothetical protein n=1 Tax=Actinoplanes sp. TBRC 11911 TaxID=2729386 RepID=UPI00145F06A4|nr:hypothetical protein [Actinoplanes sp. TBRC 11911]NMO52393.1 hypothetical protein [Actinoplanes sp. TBRC 11911]